MDRLIKPEPQVLHFLFSRCQKHNQATFNLTNLMHTMPVAISLTCSNPSLFSFPQPFSIIQPLSTSSYTIQLSKSCDDLPPLSTPPDTILVRSSMLPTRKATMEDLRLLFSKPAPHIFNDAKIPIVFVGPHVAEHLLSPCKKPLEIEFLFSKAISWCDRSQLTSLLKLSIKNGKTHFVSVLIEAGADVNHRLGDSSDDTSLLALAVGCGNPTIVEILIHYGCAIDDKFDLVLHDAAAMNRVDLMEILCLGYPEIDLNSKNSQGQTPLHMASIHAKVEAIRFLVSSGSEVDVADDEGYTPLHYASEGGDLESVEYIIDHSFVSKYALTKVGKKTPFDVAIDRGNVHLYDALRLGGILGEGARKDDVRGISKCLDDVYGANNGSSIIDERDQNGWTPLHRAAFKGNTESVKVLVGRGARVDAVADDGRTGGCYYTPLLMAIEAGHVEVSVFLMSHGAKLCPAHQGKKGNNNRSLTRRSHAAK